MRKLFPVLTTVVFGFCTHVQSKENFVYAGLPTCENEVILPKTTTPEVIVTPSDYIGITDGTDHRKFDIWRRRCDISGSEAYKYQVIFTAYPEPVNKALDVDLVIELSYEGKSKRIDYPLVGKLSAPMSKVVAESNSYPYIPYNRAVDMKICEVFCNRANPNDYFVKLTFKDVSDYNPNSLKGLSGVWYDPTYNGSGFNVVQTPNGVFMYYYGYKKDGDGQAQWLLSSVGPKRIIKGKAFNFDLFASFLGNGGSFTNKPTTDNSGLQTWGAAEVTFNSCSSGMIKLSGNDGNVIHNIIKLASIEGSTCTE